MKTNMMGWRVACWMSVLCGKILCRPNILGAAPIFPFQLNYLNQRHPYHTNQRQGHSLDVSPLDGLYGAPALPVYATEDLPTFDAPAAPKPSVTPPNMMMMDPSYYFEYKSADSERTEDADSTGFIRGQYGYKTAGGNDIIVKYSAGAETGFVIDNKEELEALLERSAAEPILMKAKPYSGEAVEIDYVGPHVDPVSMVQDASYMYGYKASDKAQSEEADASGNVKGHYSFKTADGQDFQVKYTAGVKGFVVENLDELLAKANPHSEEYAAVVAEHKVLTTKSQSAVVDPNRTPVSHSSTPEYVHEEITAEPYIHQEFEAEPYIHEEVPYIHEEIAAEPYIHDESSSISESTNKSYRFSYNNDNSEREENADADGFIKGFYKYTNDEGNTINVNYEAGTDIGFLVTNQVDVNSAVRKAIEDGSVAAAARPSSLSNVLAPIKIHGDSSDAIETFNLLQSKTLPAITRKRVKAKKSTGLTSDNLGGSIKDAAFMFNAVGDDHEFMETADDAGERTGSYSFVTPEGDKVHVKYTAGKGGFVILNPREVLPQAPLV